MRHCFSIAGKFFMGNILPRCVFLVIIALSGCSSPSVGNLPSDGEYIPPEGLPFADGTAAYAAQNDIFTLLEDTQVEGQLSYRQLPSAETPVVDPNASGPAPVADSDVPAEQPRFLLTRQPGHGSVSIDPVSGQFSYIPTQDFFGTDVFRFYVVADGAGSAEATISLAVTGVNDTPLISGEVVTVVAQNTPYRSLLEVFDADNDPLNITLQNFPEWLLFDQSTSTLYGTPGQADAGLHENISVLVADPSGEIAVLGPFTIEVIDINDSPTVNPDQFPDTLNGQEKIVVNLFPDDPDGDFVTLETEPNDFVDVTVNGGSITVTARDVTEVTRINLVVIAIDRLGSPARTIVPLTIYPVTISGRGTTLAGKRSGAGMHLVVMGDGYKEDEQNTFFADVDRVVRLMREDPAISTHLSGWNIHAITSNSVDSGIDDNVLEDFRDTAFDSGFFCRGIQRLICTNEAKVFGTALEEYPYLDQIILLINDNRYGGSGGSIAIASAHAPEVALHEMGHSIAQLGDEYVDAVIPSISVSGFTDGRFPNIAAVNDPFNVPWAHWIDDKMNYPFREFESGVGIFEGAFFQSTGFYRPTFTSRMRDNDEHFGVVNGEQWILSVYRQTNPIIEFQPVRKDLQIRSVEEQMFSVLPLFSQGIQRITWSLDGEEIEGTRDLHSISLSPEVGNYTVEMVVEDSTGRIRIPPPHAGYFSWQWQLRVIE